MSYPRLYSTHQPGTEEQEEKQEEEEEGTATIHKCKISFLS